MSRDSDQLPYGSEEWVLAKCKENEIPIPHPTSNYMIDLDGNFYSKATRGKGWIPTGKAEPGAATRLRGINAVPLGQSVNGRYLYEEPRLKPPPVLGPPALVPPIAIKQKRESRGCAWFLAVTALIMLVAAIFIGIRVYNHFTTPKIPKAEIPQITHVATYRKGRLVYFNIQYTDRGHYAEGFGFVGINGSGWAEENHLFSDPSYGIVGRRRIAYPFNLACGTANAYQSDVEAWIYDTAGDRSKPVDIHLAC
jgi:hypothetical protein